MRPSKRTNHLKKIRIIGNLAFKKNLIKKKENNKLNLEIVTDISDFESTSKTVRN